MNMNMKQLLIKLIEYPDLFTDSDLKECIKQLPHITSQSQITCLLIGINQSNLKRLNTAQTLDIISNQLNLHSLKLSNLTTSLSIKDSDSNQLEIIADIVGTGGDGKNTFNCSTAAAIVVAGCGLIVAKHGNRASSSTCGSGDVLEELGANITQFTPEKTYHPAMNVISSVRKELGIKTIFNILGPLINPAHPTHLILGAATMETGKLIAEALLLSTHIKKAWVVYGEIGLDEISPELKTRVWQIDNNLQAKNKIKRMESDEKQEEKDQKDRFIKEFTILPSDFGIKERKLASVVGGNKVYNAKIMKRLLEGYGVEKDMDEVDMQAIEDFVLMNAAALLFICERCTDLKAGVEMARQSIKSGMALKELMAFVNASNEEN